MPPNHSHGLSTWLFPFFFFNFLCLSLGIFSSFFSFVSLGFFTFPGLFGFLHLEFGSLLSSFGGGSSEAILNIGGWRPMGPGSFS